MKPLRVYYSRNNKTIMPSKSRLENESDVVDGEEVTEKAKETPSTDNETQADEKQSTVKKTSSIARFLTKKKEADDPFRFQGTGVDYKAKLIGSREVAEARGDEMCQDAMMLCKATAKASGQHKLRILFNISLEGLKIKDEKTGNELYNFPVSKVSFIARDTTDPRAFGFVYGTPEHKHKFYAIKTAQTSDHAVLSIRDMFHIVYEMKKKQMTDAQQKQEGKSENASRQKDQNANTVTTNDDCATADLLDLATELDNIQRATDQIKDVQITVTSTDDAWNQKFDDAFVRETQSGASPATEISQQPSTALNTSNGDPFGDSFVPHTNGAPPASVPPLSAPPSQPVASSLTRIDWSATTQSPPSTQPVSNPFAAIMQDPFETAAPPSASLLVPTPLLQQQSASVAIQQPGEKSNEPVKSLDDAFSKLVDLNQIVGGHANITKASSTPQSDPFAHIKRAQKPPINVLRGEPMPALSQPTTMQGPAQPAASTNPFLDMINAAPPMPPRPAATTGNVDPFANDPFFA